MPLTIRRTILADAHDLHQIYQLAAQLPDGIIRRPKEVTLAYIQTFLTDSMDNGLTLVAELKGKIVGEIHAYTPRMLNMILYDHSSTLRKTICSSLTSRTIPCF